MRAGAESGRRRAKKNFWWKSGKLGARGHGPAATRIKKGTMYFTPFCTISHCEYFVTTFKALADNSQELATLHERMAKEAPEKLNPTGK